MNLQAIARPGWSVASAVIICVAAWGQQIPAGIAVPIQIKTGLNSENDAAGKKIVGQVMQDVPLPGGGKIKEKATVIGHVLQVNKSGPAGARIVVSFDTIEKDDHDVPIKASLLAVASSMEISQAQSPINSTSNMDSTSQWTTRQVGGDIVRRGWGKAGSSGGVEGKWINGTAVVIKLTPRPEAGCPGGGEGYELEQAVWVFSSAACGTYGLSDISIAHTGATSRIGQIELKSSKKLVIRSGSGWLLMLTGGE
jgi:hypothetical protein